MNLETRKERIFLNSIIINFELNAKNITSTIFVLRKVEVELEIRKSQTNYKK